MVIECVPLEAVSYLKCHDVVPYGTARCHEDESSDNPARFSVTKKCLIGGRSEYPFFLELNRFQSLTYCQTVCSDCIYKNLPNFKPN